MPYKDKEQRKAKYAQDPRSKKDSAKKGLYGVFLSEYEDMIARQDGLCAICGECPDKHLCIDHCHNSGRVRGLLCSQCNVMIGMAKESIGTLYNAIAYLNYHDQETDEDICYSGPPNTSASTD